MPVMERGVGVPRTDADDDDDDDSEKSSSREEGKQSHASRLKTIVMCRQTIRQEAAWLLNGDVRAIWGEIEGGLTSILRMLTSELVEIVPITTMDNCLSGVVGFKHATITKADITISMHKGRGGGLKAQFKDSGFFKFQHFQGCTNWLQLAHKAVVRMRGKQTHRAPPSIPAVHRTLDDVRLWILAAKESFSKISFYSLTQLADAGDVFTPPLPVSVGVTFNIDQANLITTIFRLHQITISNARDNSYLIAKSATPEAHQIGGLHFINDNWYEIFDVKVAESIVPSLINAMSSLESVMDVTQRALLKVNALR